MIITVTLNPAIDRMYFIESMEAEGIIRCDSFNINAGGKGINVTKVLRQLGAEVHCLGFLGGTSGNFINEALRDIGVKNYFTPINGETRSCLSIMPQGGRQFELIESGPVIASRERQKFLQTFKQQLITGGIMVISGSLPRGMPEGFYNELVGIANQMDMKVILDTSGVALEHALQAKPYLIKPNVEEMEKLLGRTFNNEEELLQGTIDCMSLGAENVALSLGSGGMIFSTQDHSYRVKVPAIEVVSAVGSGDSTTAGVAYGLSVGLGLEELLINANACGVSNATMEAIGFIDVDNINEIKRGIKINKIRG